MRSCENYQYDWNLLRRTVKVTLLEISDSPFLLMLGEQKECSNTTFNDPCVNVFFCCGRTLQKFSITAQADDSLSHLISS
jgi:hypothetical protein